MSSIRVRNLRKSFGGRSGSAALQGVDLDIGDGMFLAVLGPSGCGKTTLLRALAGVDPADSGTVHLGGRPIDDDTAHTSPEERRIGLVPQEGALFPHLDVAKNIGFGLRRLDPSDRARRVAELLELIGLEGFGTRRPDELSGGQQQRVALARALAPRPEVVLLDEPFSALDASLRVSLRDQMAEVLRSAGTTAVLVTHDQEEAMAFADRVAIMRRGQIVQSGPGPELYHRPVDLWCARFLGEAVVLDGIVDRDGSSTVSTVLGALAIDQTNGALDAGQCQVMIRPEQIVRSERTESTSARVRLVRFHGPFAEIHLALDGASIIARWPSTDLPSVGDELGLDVVGTAMVFPPD